jgi:hypothetical protein
VTGVVVMLALAAAGLGCLSAGLGIRLSGVKGDLVKATKEIGAMKALAQANAIAAHDHELAAKQAVEELRQVRKAAALVEQRHRADIERLEEIAARCADASEIRRMLQGLTTPEPT